MSSKNVVKLTPPNATYPSKNGVISFARKTLLKCLISAARIYESVFREKHEKCVFEKSNSEKLE